MPRSFSRWTCHSWPSTCLWTGTWVPLPSSVVSNATVDARGECLCGHSSPVLEGMHLGAELPAGAGGRGWRGVRLTSRGITRLRSHPQRSDSPRSSWHLYCPPFLSSHPSVGAGASPAETTPGQASVALEVHRADVGLCCLTQTQVCKGLLSGLLHSSLPGWEPSGIPIP